MRATMYRLRRPRGRCEPYLGDKEEFTIDGTPSTRTTFGEYVRRLLTDQAGRQYVSPHIYLTQRYLDVRTSPMGTHVDLHPSTYHRTTLATGYRGCPSYCSAKSTRELRNSRRGPPQQQAAQQAARTAARAKMRRTCRTPTRRIRRILRRIIRRISPAGWTGSRACRGSRRRKRSSQRRRRE